VPPLRDPDPARGIHEPVLVLLPDLQAPAPQGAVVTVPGDTVRLTAWVHGHVQGVGFRWWVRSRALELGLVGWAANLEDGRVEVVAEGDRTAAESLLAALTGPGTPGRVRTVVERWAEARGKITGFAER
jgi:acylphosphatase